MKNEANKGIKKIKGIRVSPIFPSKKVLIGQVAFQFKVITFRS